jgi:hypothetical protein
MKKVLVISFSDLKRDPRPYRQILSLKKRYEVHTLGRSESGLENRFFQYKKRGLIHELIRLIFLKLGFFEIYFWDSRLKEIARTLLSVSFDLIVINEIKASQFAFRIKKPNTSILLDAHEYSPENFEDDPIWRFLYKKYFVDLCKKYLPHFNAITTVSEGIGKLYSDNFNIKPTIIKSASEFHPNLVPKPIDKKIKLIHHGLVSTSRSLHLLIELMDYLSDDYELNLMLIFTKGTEKEFLRLKKLAKDKKNIVFLPPVDRFELIAFTNKFDIGVIFFPPTNSNLKYALPNKFFEFVQSRVVLAIGPDIEMSKIVREYSLGLISTDWTPESLAEAIKACSREKLYEFKFQTDKAANILNAEKEIIRFNEVVDSLLLKNQDS